MNAFLFQAAFLCEDCATAVRRDLIRAGYRVHAEEDSDNFPCGPYSPATRGEADCPDHCDHCNAFLASDLTGDGAAYVRDALAPVLARADLSTWTRDGFADWLARCAEAQGKPVLAVWAREYRWALDPLEPAEAG